MVSTISLVLLSALALVLGNLRAVYRSASLKELHHRKREGDMLAGLLEQVAEYGASSDTVLLGLMILFSALATLVAARTLDSVFALGFIIVLIWAVFVWSPRPNKLSKAIASKLAPYFAQLLLALKPLGEQGRRFVRRHRPVTVHTGLYDKADLLELFENQKLAPGNQIERAELDIAKHALTFGDKTVKDYMTPRRVVRFVDGDEPIGPILINELHESGFSRFPVRGDDENSVIGTLYLRDLVQLKHGGIVKNAMKSRVFYVNESSSLEGVLAAFLRTKHHLFIAVNSFEEIVGIITIEDVLEQILGRKIVDEFDQYEDLRAVAKQQAAKNDAKQHKKPPETSPSGDTEAEVLK